MFSKLKMLSVIFGGIVSLMATPTLGAPVTWTIPVTPTLTIGTPDGGSISGTFVFDAALPPADRLISLNIVETGPTPNTYTFIGGQVGDFYLGQSSAVAVDGFTPIVALYLPNIPATSGQSYVAPFITVMPCRGQSGGKCVDWAGTRRADSVTISSIAPAAIPTMTEWAMILLGMMLAGGAALTIHRRRMAA